MYEEKLALLDVVLSPFRDTMPIPNASGLQPHMVNLNCDEEVVKNVARKNCLSTKVCNLSLFPTY